LLSMTLFKAPRGGAVEQSETEGVVEILRFAQYDIVVVCSSLICMAVGFTLADLRNKFYYLELPLSSLLRNATFSLRLGHLTALTVHRTVIHYRSDIRFAHYPKGQHFQCKNIIRRPMGELPSKARLRGVVEILRVAQYDII